MSDWLDIEPATLLPVVALPEDFTARLKLVETCWARLNEKQKLFLASWRECRYNARAAARQLGLSEKTKPHTGWMHEPDYAMVVRIWRANAAVNALDRDRLLARQDDIVETLLTPKPILHMGEHTGFEEVEAGAASRANEVLLQAAGVIKSGKDVEVNVGVVIGLPTLNIQVMPAPSNKAVEREGVVIDAKFTEVPK